MRYKLDLHVHTEGSPDSRLTLDAVAAAAKKRGIHAVAVSDHNRCPAPEIFEKPLRDGVLLIPSVEYSTECGHLLGLFLRRSCHVTGEENGRVSFSEAAEAIRSAGGLCVLAHPFELTHRSPEEISAQISAHAGELDGIEIFNCRATKKRRNANDLAAEAVKKLHPDALKTAGSDAHTEGELGGASVTVDAEKLSLEALREALKNPVEFSCGRCRHMAFARSQFLQIRKQKRGFTAYCKWLLFASVCVLRTVKGVFR